MLAAAAQAQPPRGAPQQPDRDGHGGVGDERQPRHVPEEAAENAGGVGDPEPVPALDAPEGIGGAGPAGEEGNAEGVDVLDARRLRDAPAGASLEDLVGQEARDSRRHHQDGRAGDDVVHAEADRCDGVQQAADGPAGGADEHAPPGAELQGTVGAEPGAEDEHALQADVHHAGPLGEDAAHGRHQDRHRVGERDRPGRAVGELVGGRPGELLGEGEERHADDGDDGEPQPPLELAILRRVRRPRVPARPAGEALERPPRLRRVAVGGGLGVECHVAGLVSDSVAPDGIPVAGSGSSDAMASEAARASSAWRRRCTTT